MLSWAEQRKLLLLFWIVVFLVAILSVYGFFTFYRGASCSNNVKDGNERGIDCGGSCARVCRADVLLPVINFVRTLEVADGVWGAVAYGENPNAGAGARNVPYVFKLYDEENLLLYERHGIAFIPPRKVFAVFEGKMFSGSRTPARATFEFLKEPVFEHIVEPELSLDTKDFEADEHGSSLKAILTNPTRNTIEGIGAVALLFGTDGNITGASATFVSKLLAGSSAMLIFTWPRELEHPARTEILYTVPGRP